MKPHEPPQGAQSLKPGESAEPIAGLHKGDRVYFKSRTGQATLGDVMCTGEHGFMAKCTQGRQHKVPWDKYVSHHTRKRLHATVIEHGADGSLAELRDGRRVVFARGEEEEPMSKALILFMKGGPVANRPGLALQAVTDAAGHQTKRWKKTGGDERGAKHGYGTQHVDVGDELHYEHPQSGKTVSGHVQASGAKGATIKAPSGEVHKVTWDKIRGAPPKKPPAPEGGGAGGGKGEGGEPAKDWRTLPAKVHPDQFKAADHYTQHDKPEVTEDTVMAGMSDDTKKNMAAAQERLAGIEETHKKHKDASGEYSAERKALHHKIIYGSDEKHADDHPDETKRGKLKHPGFLTQQQVEGAKPAEGEAPTFTVLGGRGGCLSADHEFLTRAGWKRIDQFQDGDQILAVDLKAGTSQFERPAEYIRLPCESFYHFKARGVDMMLSEEHRVPFVKKYNRDTWRELTANAIVAQHRELADGWDGLIPCAYPAPNNTAGVALTDDELRLMVAACADGHFSSNAMTARCRVAVRKSRKKERLEALLTKCGRNFKVYVNPERPTERRYSFDAPHRNKSLAAYWPASPAQLAVIADEVLHWDGWEDRYGSWIFTSTVKADIDFVAYAFGTQGRRTSFYQDDRTETNNWQPIWRVAAAKNGAFAGLRGASDPTQTIQAVPAADGFKYCFRVSTGYFLTRRNDCVCVTGNSGKGSFKGNVYDPKKAITLDADAIKEQMPEYQGWNAHQLHEESGELFDRITDEAQKQRLNIVHDATMKTPQKAVDTVKRFKGDGYKVAAHYMHLPRHMAVDRAIKRFEGKTNRLVPPKVILGNTENEKAFDQVRDHADEWSFWDNQGAKPELVSHSHAGQSAK